MKNKIILTLFIICGTCFSFSILVSWKAAHPTISNAEIQASAIKGFALLQTSGAVFISKVKCASCHHAVITSMVAATFSKKGITGIDTTAAMREAALVNSLKYAANPNMNNDFITAKFISPYILMALDAQKYPASIVTDIAVDFIISQAMPDGSFKAEYARVPLEAGDIHLSALSVRALQLYAAPAKAKQVQQIITHCRQWLEKQQPQNQQELAFQLLGLQWCHSSPDNITAVANKLIAIQNKDGGWCQLNTMASDAYATGQALYALEEAGLQEKQRDVFERGLQYLLRTQQASGAWPMVTRSNPIQPFVNSEFPPYDDNQFIAAAASNWATLALAGALPDKN